MGNAWLFVLKFLMENVVMFVTAWESHELLRQSYIYIVIGEIQDRRRQQAKNNNNKRRSEELFGETNLFGVSLQRTSFCLTLFVLQTEISHNYQRQLKLFAAESRWVLALIVIVMPL
jgi:hypothetical protein